jgi:hypothetical protein
MAGNRVEMSGFSMRDEAFIGILALAPWACYPAPMVAKRDDEYSDEEADRRMRETVKRALSMPPKLAKEIAGKGRTKGASKPGEKRQEKP